MRFENAGLCTCGHERELHSSTGCFAIRLQRNALHGSGCWCPGFDSKAEADRHQEEMDYYASRVALLN